jgi:hypothetical protein
MAGEIRNDSPYQVAVRLGFNVGEEGRSFIKSLNRFYSDESFIEGEKYSLVGSYDPGNHLFYFFGDKDSAEEFALKVRDSGLAEDAFIDAISTPKYFT